MPHTGTETILVVDDEVTIRSIAQRMLARYGYRVLLAHSGEAALHLVGLSELVIDLALIDIIMPEMNGIELAERIGHVRPNLPILFFSAYSDREELRPILARKLPYISKPFTSVKLTKRIREMLDGSNADAASEQG
jgi:two-component system cell cycle sensor histidine kinase/response regulator CckA